MKRLILAILLLAATAKAQGTPFIGGPYAVPGKVEAENYNLGGSGTAYHVCNATNQGGAYRMDAVSIEPTTDTGGGFDVGWVCPGDWENYTVNVGSAGLPVGSQVSLRVASNGVGGTMHLSFRNALRKWVTITGEIHIPNTGGWQTWTTVTATTTKALPGGKRFVRVVYDTATGGFVGNLNWFSLGVTSINIVLSPMNPTVCLTMGPGCTNPMTQQFRALDQNGNDITSQVIFTSSNPAIASITPGGLSIAVSNPSAPATDSVTITATLPALARKAPVKKHIVGSTKLKVVPKK